MGVGVGVGVASSREETRQVCYGSRSDGRVPVDESMVGQQGQRAASARESSQGERRQGERRQGKSEEMKGRRRALGPSQLDSTLRNTADQIIAVRANPRPVSWACVLPHAYMGPGRVFARVMQRLPVPCPQVSEYLYIYMHTYILQPPLLPS